MSKMHQMQIFVDHELFSALAKIIWRERTSISEIIHAAMKEWITGHREQDMLNKRLEDLQVIRNHRQEILARRDGKPLEFDAAGVIEQMRNERADELLASVLNGPTLYPRGTTHKCAC